MLKKHGKRILSETKKVLLSEDSPQSVSMGFSIGIFLGFSPLFGLKTLLALGIAWALRKNKIAAVVGVTFHDLFLPLIPFILRAEYDVGYWLLNHHELPPHLNRHETHIGMWLHWSTFLSVGRPLLVGSLVVGGPIAILTYFVLKFILDRRRVARHQADLDPQEQK